MKKCLVLIVLLLSLCLFACDTKEPVELEQIDINVTSSSGKYALSIDNLKDKDYETTFVTDEELLFTKVTIKFASNFDLNAALVVNLKVDGEIVIPENLNIEDKTVKFKIVDAMWSPVA